MNQEAIKQKLYDKYIAPTAKKRADYIGIEIELPIVNLEKKPVDFEQVKVITERFVKVFDFEVTGKDKNDMIYAAQDKETGDILSYDCSYNNLEFSLGKGKDIHTLNERFKMYYTWFQTEFGKVNHCLTGMGVNPYRNFNNNIPIENERYRMLFHHLASYDKYVDVPMYFHNYPAYGLFSSASQVQLDIEQDKLIQTIRAFSKLEPVKAVLFSNSILLDEKEEFLCCRDLFWEHSTHGINPHNIGMFDAIPESIDELCAYIESTSLYCVERDGKYVNFEPIGVMDYFKQDFITGEYFDGTQYRTMEIKPELNDIDYLRTFKFEDLTFRGTIEFRSVCCQPVSDAMTVAAYHIGLKNNLEKLDALLEQDMVLYHHGYTATELRKLFVKSKLPGFVEEEALYDLVKQTIDFAKEGLMQRGYGEECYLAPLYKRVESRENPAQYVLRRRDEGVALKELIKEYGEL